MVVALVFAGGSGVRMGSELPKQFLEIAGKPVLAHTLSLFQEHAKVDGIWIVAAREYFSHVRKIVVEHGITKTCGITEGGESAQESIYNGLKAVAEKEPTDTIVLIHDGVRPYVEPDVISANIAGVRRNGNAITFTPCFETLVLSEDGRQISDIPLRRMSYSAQAPQSFRLGDILGAHNRIRAAPGGYTDMVDQATICWKLGVPIHLVPGNRGNIKITTPEDIEMLSALIKWRTGSLHA